MKNFWAIARWLGGQVKPSIIPILFITGLSAISSLCGVSMAVAAKIMIDSAIKQNLHKTVEAGIVFALIILLMTGLHALLSLSSVRIYERFSRHLRQRMFIKLTEVQYSEIIRYHSGDIITRMTSDIGIVANGMAYILPGIMSLAVGLLAAFLTLLYYDSTLAILAFVLGPISIIVSRLLGNKLKKFHHKMQESESKYRSFIQECFEHMYIIKTFCYERESVDKLGKLQDEKISWTLRRNRFSVASSSVLALGYWVGYFLAFGWGAMRLMDGRTSFGTFTVFLQLVQQVQSPFIGLAHNVPQIISMMASIERILEIERLPSEVTTVRVSEYTAVQISYKDVSFEYKQGNPVLNNISLDIQPGQIVGLIGTSGDGKTTLIRLLLSLLQPSSGAIKIYCSHNEHLNVSASTRSLISYVPQENSLFSGTIMDNLRIGCKDATEEEMINTLNSVGAWDFIESLPDRLNTYIGERGIGLSVGQAQRIAIARAFLRKTPILILDEATSSLDLFTEQRILRSIEHLQHMPTCIVITHRPSLLDICHRVYKLSNGKLDECICNRTNVVPATEVI